MIKITNLVKTYDKQIEAVNIKDLELKDNRIIGIIGVNGSGKSTLLRLISGVYKEDLGNILFDGKEIYDNEEVKKDILFISDNPFASTNSSIKTIEEYYNTFYKMNLEKFNQNLKLFDLPLKGNLNKFSKGMRRRVFIAVALSILPKILILDEAFDGIDPLGRELFKKELIKSYQDKNLIVLIASHSLRELEDICDEYVLLKNGKVISVGAINMEDSKLHKYIVGFKEAISKENLNYNDFISVYGQGKVYTIITKLDLETFTKSLKELNPVLVDEQELTFEELFINTNKEGI